MTVSLTNALEDLRSRINETTQAYFQTSDLTNWLNQGCADIARKARCLQDSISIEIYPNNAQYQAPTNLLSTHHASFLPSGSQFVYPLEIKLYSEMDAIWGTTQQIQAFYPTHLTQWLSPPNTYYVIFPTPSAAGVLNVQYYRSATVASGSQNLDVPQGWEDLPILFALYTTLFKALDPRWKQIRDLYREEMADMVSAAQGFTDAVASMSYPTAYGPLWQFGYGGFGTGGW